MALLITLGASTSFQMKEYPFYGAINVNLFRITGNGSEGSTIGPHPALRLGYNYHRYFALEISGGWGKTKPSDPESSGITAWTSSSDIGASTTLYNIDLGMRLTAFPKAGVTPYLALGLGKLYWSVKNNDVIESSEFYEKYGETFNNNYLYYNIGIENRFTDRFSLNIELKQKAIFGNTDNMLGDLKSPNTLTQVGIGFCFKFGKGVYEKIDLEGIEAVHFEFNSIKLTKESELLVKQVAEAMKKNPRLVIEVRGFTDNTGSDEVNMRMSKKRSITVKQMLVNLGINSARIITTSMGHEFPVATNATPEGRAMNRRVEFYELEK